MSTEFASAGLTAGQLNAIVKKLGGHEKALAFLRGELSVSEPARSWREEDGVIYFSVTSDGTTGEDWLRRLKDNGFRVGSGALRVLRSPDFKPTNGVTTKVAVLNGNTLVEDDFRFICRIRAEANKRKLIVPNAEVACLIRLKFRDKEIEAMGLRHIVVVHERINDSEGVPALLCAHRAGAGCWLDASYDGPDGAWCRDIGFAFAVSQVSSEACPS